MKDGYRSLVLAVALFVVGMCVVFDRPSAAGTSGVDVPITAIGPIRDLARNVTIAAGSGGIANNYILTPNFTNEGLCVFISNQSSNTLNLNLTVYGTGDQTVSTYSGNTANWASLGPTSGMVAGTNAGSQNINPIAAGAVASFFTQVAGAARVAVVILLPGGGSAPGPITATIVESQNGVGCGNVPVGPITCNMNNSIAVSGSSSAQLPPNPESGQNIYLCDLVITAGGALASGNISIGYQATNCSGTGGQSWKILTGSTTPTFLHDSGSPLLTANVASAPGSTTSGLFLCVFNEQATAIEVSYTAAEF